MRNSFRLLLVFAVVFPFGCGDAVEPEQEQVATALLKVRGDDQEGVVGTELPTPLVVKVDDQNGNAMDSATVTWTVVSGGGQLSASTSVTQPNGQAFVRWTLGPEAGEQHVRASMNQLEPVTFTAVALPDRAARLSIEVEAYPPLDTVAQSDSLFRFDAVGDSVALRASVEDRYGNVLDVEDVAWTHVGDALTVGDDGVVVSRGAGADTVTAQVDTAQAVQAFLVDPRVTSLAVTASADMLTSAGDTVELEVAATDRNGYTVEDTARWRSLDPDVGAVVDSVGPATRVVPVSSGVVRVEVTCQAMADTARLTVQLFPEQPDSLVVTARSTDTLELGWRDNSDTETVFEIDRRRDGDAAWALADSVGADSTTWLDGGLDVFTTYSYRVRACNDAGCSDYTDPDSATTLDVVPAAPDSVVATALSSDTVRVVWRDNSDNETGFEVQRRTASGNWAQAVVVEADSTSILDGALSPAKSYYYKVRACNSGGCSAFSAVDSTTTPDVPPQAPDSLEAVAVSFDTVALSWRDNSGNETGFEIERKASGEMAWTVMDTTAADSTAWRDTTVAASTAYRYQLRACNEIGCSQWVVSDSVTTPAVPPAAPDNLTATATSPSTIDLAWRDNSDDETGFEIQRHEAGVSTWTVADTAAAEAVGWTDSGLMEGTEYWYRIRACAPGTCSAFAGPTSATTQTNAPTASFTVSKSEGTTLTTFQFDASASSDPQDGSSVEVRWDWQNDGTWDTSWSSSKTATHQFASTGQWTVVLQVRDQDTNTATATQSVTVYRPLRIMETYGPFQDVAGIDHLPSSDSAETFFVQWLDPYVVKTQGDEVIWSQAFPEPLEGGRKYGGLELVGSSDAANVWIAVLDRDAGDPNVLYVDGSDYGSLIRSARVYDGAYEYTFEDVARVGDTLFLLNSFRKDVVVVDTALTSVGFVAIDGIEGDGYTYSPIEYTGIAFGDNHLWITVRSNDTSVPSLIVKLDESFNVVRRFEIGDLEPEGISWNHTTNTLFISTTQSVYGGDSYIHRLGPEY